MIITVNFQMVKMLKLVIIAIFQCISLADDCQSQFNVQRGGLKCKISFVNDQNICSQSLFDKCEIEYCASSSQIYSSSSKCSLPISYVDKNFQNCMNFCCRSQQKLTSQYLSIKSCANVVNTSKGNQQLSSSGIVSIICIALGVALVLITASYCIINKCIKRQIHFSQNPNPQAQISNKGASCNIMDQISISNLIADRKWEATQVNKDDLDTCIICLCQNPNLKLDCGHYFHPECFRMWVKKKRQCGVCRSKQIRKLEVTCERCYKNKTIITLMDFVYLKNNYQKLLCC